MTRQIWKYLALMLVGCFSGVLTSCGDDDKGKDEPTPPQPESPEYNEIYVTYSISLSEAYYDFWDIQLTYTTIGGEEKTIHITEDWGTIYQFKPTDEIPTNYVLRLSANPKPGAPTPSAYETYTLSRRCFLSITGLKFDALHMPEILGGSMATPQESYLHAEGSQVAEMMTKPRNLGEYSYTIKL